MSPGQLQAALERLKLSPPAAAQQLGVARSALYHWLAGRRPIPGPVDAAVTCWLQLKRKGKP